MGIFTRVRDIISSNINAMLDKAEDPEKLVKLMIREMEDTLVEVKASCAGAMATKKKIQREAEDVRRREKDWGDKAQLAVNKGREDLAREALVERKRYRERAEAIDREQTQCDSLVEQYQADIMQLEDKLAMAREKQRVMVQRHVHATRKKKAQENIRRAETADTMARFETFEQRIDRMEAEADLVNLGVKSSSLEEEFLKLAEDEEIEKELQELKAQKGSSSNPA
ncbi:MAG: phage shock protein PspA [Candidatus Hydrogenedentes bacterium]|nr:phage shock protein PspA [Candidatus Hydrogenedentota bacterium]